MFFLELFKVIWLSLVIHLVVTCGVLTLGWFAVTRLYRNLQFKLLAPIVVGATLSLAYAGHTFVTVYQNKLINEAQQAFNQKAQADQQAQLQAAQKMKEDLLKNVDQMIQNSSLITAENKQKLFQTFAPLMPTPQDKSRVVNSIYTAFACQRFFLADALESFKSKKSVKSEDRAKCETYEGAFFGREKLIPADVAKANDETILALASRKKINGPDGKPQDITEAKLKASVEAQDKALENLKLIFQ